MQIPLPTNEVIIECAKEAASRNGYQNLNDPIKRDGRLKHEQVHITEWYVTMKAEKQAKSVTIKVTVSLATGLDLYAEPKIEELN
jgi:hypothetical protein